VPPSFHGGMGNGLFFFPGYMFPPPIWLPVAVNKGVFYSSGLKAAEGLFSLFTFFSSSGDIDLRHFSHQK